MGILQKALGVIVRKAMLTVAIAAGKKILGKAVAPTDNPNAQSNALDDSDKPSDFLSTEMPQAKANSTDAEVTGEPKKSGTGQARSRSPRSPGKQTKTTTPQESQEVQEAPPKKPTRSRKPAQTASTGSAVADTADTKPKKPRAPRKKTPPADT